MIYFILFFYLIKGYPIITIYQQSHYEIKAYLRHFYKNIIYYLVIPILLIVPSFFNDLLGYIFLLILVLYSFLFLRFKVRLKFSRRIKRIMLLYLLNSLWAFIPIIGSYLLIFSEYLFVIIIYIDYLFSYLSNKKYLKLAKIKIDKYSGNIIGITGSCGKTSTKNYLNNVLSVTSTSSTTPHSYNTTLGITKYINDTKIDLYDNLIIEFGASKENDIKKSLKVVSPNISIITEITYMHMEGFKTIENLINEKMRLAKNSKVVIINCENDYLRNYPLYNKIVLSYGFNYGDYQAKHVKQSSFDLYFKKNYIHTFNHHLIGRANVLNLLAVIVCYLYLGYDINILANSILLLDNYQNRLELKQIENDSYILDDSFNSNPKGFLMALEKISNFDGLRILLTPGILELGKYYKYVYKRICNSIVYSTDIVIIIRNIDSYKLISILKKFNITLYVVNSFREGYKLYQVISNDKKHILLIENDITDLYRKGLIGC